ncbi:preprotein translocase subunit SecE [Candidatus Gracilibacteria bacterium]|nr:preprotein translocase subunit SecE [Candidatus Gracilibacteria bacterium]
MIRFIKDSIRELKHVVWPTRKETQKFFGLVLALIIVFGIYLFIFSHIFSESLFSLKNMFGTGESQVQSVDFDSSGIFIDEDNTLQEGENLFEDESFDIDIDFEEDVVIDGDDTEMSE